MADAASGPSAMPPARAGTLERIADVPIYAVDPIVRRAPALQRTADARSPAVGIPSELAAERGIVDGTPVRVSQGGARVVLPARVDASLAANVIRVAAGHSLTAALGPMFGTLTIDVVAVGDGGAATASSREAAPS
jgi:NADH-quinone oxidoreductase subunit G